MAIVARLFVNRNITSPIDRDVRSQPKYHRNTTSPIDRDVRSQPKYHIIGFVLAFQPKHRCALNIALHCIPAGLDEQNHFDHPTTARSRADQPFYRRQRAVSDLDFYCDISVDKKSRNDRRWTKTADLSSLNISPITDRADRVLFTTKSSKRRSK
jgi:hypothetical protein